MSGNTDDVGGAEMEKRSPDTVTADVAETEVKLEPIKGPLLGVAWFFMLFIVYGIVFGLADYDTLVVFFGWRSMIALAGYLIMQVGLWHAENKWDEEGSVSFLKAAGQDANQAPEALEVMNLNATIPEDELKAAFPIAWGFLIGWWVWGISYLFPMDGTSDVKPTVWGIIACVVSFIISFVASIPMADAVQNRNPEKKKILSLMFLTGWIILGVMSSLDASKCLDDMDDFKDQSRLGVWIQCMLGPFTIILSQQILFSSRKMGTFWEQEGKPNFHPIVYNMGGPLFVLGWFVLWLGTSSVPMEFGSNIYANIPNYNAYLPLFLNWRTWLSFMSGCAMVPVVRFLDFSHDEDGLWCNENDEGKIFTKFWLGTDGTYYGLFLESPWPFVISWTLFGFSSFFAWDNSFDVNIREIIIFLNCILQGVDAGILIQQNLYAGNMDGKNRWSLPFLALFIALAINIGSRWDWNALALSLPGALLIICGQKTVFGARKRGDYTMQNAGKANPYDQVFVYTWGEVFFMMGWILICWGMAMPSDP